MKNKLNNRKLKSLIKQELVTKEFNTAIQLVQKYPPVQLVNPLISFFCSVDKILRWRAISTLGVVVNNITKESYEKARIVMRRLMWSLNDESGGIGWGAPEAMGEIMAQNQVLAEEYSKILLSYLDQHGNFLEYEPLQQGVLWGIKSLSETRPELVVKALDLTRNYMNSDNAVSRALALMISENTLDYKSETEIKRLLKDQAEVEIYESGDFRSLQISRLASGVLAVFLQKEKKDSEK